MRKTTIIRVRISPEHKAQIKQYCKESGRTMSELIREQFKIIKNERK
jgi:antitoxin component of RelBE/YafQ-DinJ toxin-antitoxin module